MKMTGEWDVSSEFVKRFDRSVLRDIINDAVREFELRLTNALDCWLSDDMDPQVATFIESRVDNIVDNILGGHRPTLEKYALGPIRLDARTAVAKYLADEVAKERISELEKRCENYERRRWGE